MKFINEDINTLFFSNEELDKKKRTLNESTTNKTAVENKLDKKPINEDIEGEENIPDENGVLVYTGGEVPEEYRDKVKKVIFADGVTSIKDYAFYYYSSLTSITIPSSVTSIGNSAFNGCRNLTSVTFAKGSQCTGIGRYAFASCESLTSIDIPSSVTSIGKYAFHYCRGLTSITIPSSVTSIGDSAFHKCSGLTSITIPSSVTSIGNSAFDDCSSLTSIDIPSSVTSIGDRAFAYCINLTIIEIPSSVTSIGDDAFWGCSNLTTITIPSSVTSIGKWAFYHCYYLTIYCKKGSYADEYAQENNIPVKYDINESINESKKLNENNLSVKEMFVNGAIAVDPVSDEEFEVKPLMFDEQLLRLIDKDGDETRMYISDVLETYDIYDYRGNKVSDREEYISNNVNESKKLNEAPYLEPIHDARKSFYDKAFIDKDGDGNYILKSYDTLVAKIVDGNPEVYTNVNMWDSQTTLRHIKEFLKQHGFKADTKAQIARDYGTDLAESIEDGIVYINVYKYGDDGNKICEFSHKFRDIDSAKREMALRIKEIKSNDDDELTYEYIDSDEDFVKYTVDGIHMYEHIEDFKCGDKSESLCKKKLHEGKEPEEITSDYVDKVIEDADYAVSAIRPDLMKYMTKYDVIERLGDTIRLTSTDTGEIVEGNPPQAIFNRFDFYKKDGSIVHDSDFDKQYPDSTGTIIYDGTPIAAKGSGKVETVIFKDGISKIDSDMTDDFIGTVKKVVIPNSVVEIADYAFSEADVLTEVIFSEGSRLKRIGVEAFYGCENLHRIDIPATTNFIGKRAFSFCPLKRITIPGSLKRIENDVFNYVSEAVVYIENGVEEIGDFAFDGGVSEIHIPNSVKTIGKLFGDATWRSVEKLKIYCDRGSYAYKYALSRGIPVNGFEKNFFDMGGEEFVLKDDSYVDMTDAITDAVSMEFVPIYAIRLSTGKLETCVIFGYDDPEGGYYAKIYSGRSYDGDFDRLVSRAIDTIYPDYDLSIDYEDDDEDLGGKSESLNKKKLHEGYATWEINDAYSELIKELADRVDDPDDENDIYRAVDDGLIYNEDKLAAILKVLNSTNNAIDIIMDEYEIYDKLYSDVKDYKKSENLTEDTVKVKDGVWVNKGDDGTHGKFKTKKEADAQRKAMFANGYKSDRR